MQGKKRKEYVVIELSIGFKIRLGEYYVPNNNRDRTK